MPNDRDFKRRILAESLSDRFGLTLIEGDALAAEAVARDAYDEGMPYDLIQDAIVTPALHRIGTLWERGEISVAHEHLATQISYRVLALLRELFRVTRQRSEHRVMLAAVEGEQHVVALQMAADLLDYSGYESIMLGPDVPTGVLGEIVHEHTPEIVAFTLTMQAAAVKLPRAVATIEAAHPGAAVIIGGRGAGGRFPEPAGLAFVARVADVVDAADALVRRPQLN